MIKRMMIVFLTLTILSACASRSNEPSATQVVDTYLKEVLASETSEAFGQAKSESEEQLYKKIAELMSAVTYTLDNEQVNENKATVDGHFKVYDMASSYDRMIERLVEEVSADQETKSDEETSERVYTLWLEELEKIEERGADLDFHYSFELEKGDSGWVVDDVSGDRTFLDGIMGGLISTIES